MTSSDVIKLSGYKAATIDTRRKREEEEEVDG